MDILILRSAEHPDNALHRLQSTPLHQGLIALGIRARLVKAEEDSLPTHVVFHYSDQPAIAQAIAIRKTRKVKLICLCSDIYGPQHYRDLDGVTDLFLAPTALHCNVLQSFLTRPVRLLPEAVDPIARPGAGPEIPVAADNRICWFGYPESFAKSMRFLLPRALLDAGVGMERLGLITAPGTVLLEGAAHLPFSAASFYRHSAGFSHALLSHFAFDLHLNTFIKSPNKMITAIVRGQVPLVSATPAYVTMAQKLGIAGLCFRGPDDLVRLLRDLDYGRDVSKYRLAEIRKELLRVFSPEVIARSFLGTIG